MTRYVKPGAFGAKSSEDGPSAMLWMRFEPCVYVSFCGASWEIFGRMMEARLDVWELGEALCSARIVVLKAMQELSGT